MITGYLAPENSLRCEVRREIAACRQGGLCECAQRTTGEHTEFEHCKRMNFKTATDWHNEIVSQTRAKLFGTHFFHFLVSDIRLWRMTVCSMEKHR
jgi:hypothetical protein